MNNESMLKGRMAETLVEELLRQCGNIVYRFGYEAIVQNLTQLEEKFYRFSEVGERLRAMPDFIVVNKKGTPSFVEVKFRWRPDLELHKETLEIIRRVQKYWNAKLIFVNCWQRPYFRISDPPYIDRNKKLVSRPLLEENEWRIDKNLYGESERLVHKYLTPTLVPSSDKNTWR